MTGSAARTALLRAIEFVGYGFRDLALGRDTKAEEALQLALHSNPHWSRTGAFLAAAEALAVLAGNIDSAKQYLAEYAEVDPGMTVRRFAAERSSVPLEAVSPAYLRGLDRILEGLHRGGMPEQ